MVAIRLTCETCKTILELPVGNLPHPKPPECWSCGRELMTQAAWTDLRDGAQEEKKS